MNDDLRNAIALIKEGRKDEANVVLRHVLDEQPDSADAWYLFAVAAPTREYAIRHLRKALEFDPAHGKANAALVRLTMEPEKRAKAPRPRSRRWLVIALLLLVIILVIIAAALLATGTITLGTIIPSAHDPAAISLLPGTIIYHEPFDSAAEWQWTADEHEEGSVAVRGGTLQITANDPAWFLWNYNNARRFADGVFEVDVQEVADAPLDEAALLLRVDEETGDYYGFVISDGGYAAALYCERWCTDGYEAPLAVAALPAIRSEPGATNHLRVVASGPDFSYYINGQLAGTFSHTGRTAGRVGLYASFAPGTTGPAALVFDNLLVRALP